MRGVRCRTALYYAVITATTVGYGDVAIHTPTARMWASAHIFVSVSWLAALFGQIDKCSAFRRAHLARAVLLTRPLEASEVTSLDQDGEGVDKLEFVIGMLQVCLHAEAHTSGTACLATTLTIIFTCVLQLLGVELCGERLQWADVRPFIQKFDELDANLSGRVDHRDLERFVKDDRATKQRRLELMTPQSVDLVEEFFASEEEEAEYVARRMGTPVDIKARIARNWDVARDASRTAPVAQQQANVIRRIVMLKRSVSSLGSQVLPPVHHAAPPERPRAMELSSVTEDSGC